MEFEEGRAAPIALYTYQRGEVRLRPPPPHYQLLGVGFHDNKGRSSDGGEDLSG